MIIQDNYLSWYRAHVDKFGDKPLQRNDWWYSPYNSMLNRDNAHLNGKERGDDWIADILAKAVGSMK